MARSRLHELSERGVSVWIDTLSREMLETGELARLMADDAVVGVTSNPTIFQKALSEAEWYDEQLREAAKETEDPLELFFTLALEDIRRNGGKYAGNGIDSVRRYASAVGLYDGPVDDDDGGDFDQGDSDNENFDGDEDEEVPIEQRSD